ncbi:MAG: spore germination protein [Firmicutes bacterium]|nr:spore germination protein [Bacillota bacterium]
MFNKKYFLNTLKEIEISNLDIKKRELKNKSNEVIILYIEQLTDRKMLANDIIKPINIYLTNNPSKILAKEVLNNIVYSTKCIIDDKEEKIIDYILDGMAILILSNNKKYIAIDLKKVEKRDVDTPELTYTLKGPRDSFVENLDINLSLVRYRIKDPKLNINKLKIGRRAKTNVAILHIEDIANESIVDDVTKRVKNIDVDGIISSGELQIKAESPLL